MIIWGVITSLKNIISNYEKPKPENAPQETDGELIQNTEKLLQVMEMTQQAKANNDVLTERQCLSMKYEGPLPTKNPDGTYSNMYKDVLMVNIAGCNYRDKEILSTHCGQFSGSLIPEPGNEYDPNAIKVVHSDGTLLGYVPSVKIEEVRAFISMAFPYTVKGFIESEDNNNDEGESEEYFWGQIRIEK